MINKRTVITKEGLRYKKRGQIRSRGVDIPRYSAVIAEAGGKKAAHRCVRRRYKEERREKVWRFRLFRDDDTTVRDGAGNITEASGYTIDPTFLYKIQIEAGGERVSLHINNYVVKNEDDTYTLKNKNKEDFIFGDYWTSFEGIWYYDDTVGYPYNPKTGYFNPVNGYYTVNIPTEKVGRLLGNYGGNSEYWTLSEDEKIWHFDNGEWTGSYNLASKYYTINSIKQVATAKVVSPAETSPNDTEFWATYNCRKHFVPDSYYDDDDGWCLNSIPILIGYPYKYKKAGQYDEENKIPQGKYEANVPYWEVSAYSYDPEPDIITHSDSERLCNPVNNFALIPGVIEEVDMLGDAQAGSGYNINDILILAEDIPCSGPIFCEDEATAKVTSINDSGGVLAVELITGGHEYSTGVVATASSESSGIGCKINITAIEEDFYGYGFFVSTYQRNRNLKTSIPYFTRRRIWAEYWLSVVFSPRGYGRSIIHGAPNACIGYACSNPPKCISLSGKEYWWPNIKYYKEEDTLITDMDHLYYHTKDSPPYAVIDNSEWQPRPDSIGTSIQKIMKVVNENPTDCHVACYTPECEKIYVDVTQTCTVVKNCKHFFIEFQYED